MYTSFVCGKQEFKRTEKQMSTKKKEDKKLYQKEQNSFKNLTDIWHARSCEVIRTFDETKRTEAVGITYHWIEKRWIYKLPTDEKEKYNNSFFYVLKRDLDNQQHDGST